MTKSRDAFRTISEVSTALDTPTHVLRFWESKFAQIKPVKRAGGRRYYRPEDISLLSGIKVLLHDQGMTIKEAQKLLREDGVKQVVALGDAEMTTAPNDAPVVVQAAPDAHTGTDDKKPVLRHTTTAFQGRITLLDRPRILANAAEIVPILARLEKLRDAIRAA